MKDLLRALEMYFNSIIENTLKIYGTLLNITLKSQKHVYCLGLEREKANY